MNILCVAEKPSIAKSVANILSGGDYRTSSTANQYVKNYEFSQTHEGRPCNMTMTALLGHLMEIDFAPQWKKWMASTLRQLFDATIIKNVKSDMTQLSTNLKSLARHSQMLVIWTDCDREGENIGAEVAAVCRMVNPRIVVKRALFSVIQPREVNSAWNSLVELDMLAAAAVDARTELDLRVGAIFTRFQTLRLKYRFTELQDKKVISYGPCQFPTLGFVVERFQRAQSFVEEPFWTIDVSVSKDGVEAKFKWTRDHLFDHHVALILYELCVDQPQGTITDVTAKPTSKWTPLPLNTVELQKNGSRFLKLPSDRVMQVAEALYNQGIISYPRTETDAFADGFELIPLIAKQTQDPQWGNYAAELLNGKFRKPRKGKNNDQAHPPIFPVRAAMNLQGDEKKVFDFITRRFLACCSNEAKGHSTTIKLKIAQEEFVAKGLMILERNFLDVYPFEKWTDNHIPVFQVGERVIPSALEMNEGKTSRPNLLTEADLITLMDKNGIGTDATIHEHIKMILNREYARKEGIYFHPTTLGMALVTAYDQMDIDFSLSKPFLRSMMEAYMKDVCEGKKRSDEVIEEIKHVYRDVFTYIEANQHILDESCANYFGHGPDVDPSAHNGGNSFENQPVVRKCPKCGIAMTLRQTRASKAWVVGCCGYPACKESVFCPNSVCDARISENTCRVCSRDDNLVYRVKLTFNPQFAPPEYTHGHETCLWCDGELKALGNTNFTQCATEASQPSSNNFTTIAPKRPHQTAFCSEQPPVASSSYRPPFNPTTNNIPNNASDTGPNCLCNQPSVVLTVKKEGPNTGKQFYRCAKYQSDATKCDYFEWCDAVNPRMDGSANLGMSTMYQQQQMASSSSGEKPKCSCGLIVVTKQVSKDGPTKGKYFNACVKTSKGCNFFEWTDHTGTATVGISGLSNVGFCGASGNVCYNCKETGHFAIACPKRGAGGSSSSSSKKTRSSGGRGSRGGRGGKKGRQTSTNTSSIGTMGV